MSTEQKICAWGNRRASPSEIETSHTESTALPMKKDLLIMMDEVRCRWLLIKELISPIVERGADVKGCSSRKMRLNFYLRHDLHSGSACLNANFVCFQLEQERRLGFTYYTATTGIRVCMLILIPEYISFPNLRTVSRREVRYLWWRSDPGSSSCLSV